MKNKKVRVIAISLVILIFFSQPISAIGFGNTIQEGNRTDNESYITNFSNYSMKGVFSRTEELFYIENQWDVSNAKVHLEYQTTQLADQELSSITIGINDNYFYSFHPENNTGEIVSFDVYIPLGYLELGYNRIQVDGYMRTQESQPCVDDVSDANWLNILESSYINIEYDKNKFTATIANFYQRFYAIDSVRNQDAVFVVSNSENEAEITGALLGIAGLSNQTIYSEGYFPLLTVDDSEVNQAKNRIVIMGYDQLSENYRQITDSKEILTEDNGILTLINDDNGNNILLITSKDNEILINAGRLLGNSDLMMQLTSNTKILEKNEEVNTPLMEAETYISFTENQSTYYKGPFHQSKEFFVTYPSNRKISDGSEIYLGYRYSENLDFDRSLITVYVNDIPIGSQKLSQEKANGDEATVLIPINLENHGSFQVRVTFDLEIKDLWCSLRQGEMPWAFLNDESQIKLNSVSTQDLIFENYPNPFVDDYNMNQIALVLPDTIDHDTYMTIGKAFRVIGRYTKGNNGTFSVVRSNEINDLTKNSNIIAIGNDQNNDFIRNNNDKLYFKYNAEGTAIISNEKLKIDPNYGETLGALQLIKSPYQKPGRGVLVITAPTRAGIINSGNYIGKIDNLAKLEGDGNLVDYDGNIFGYRFKEKTASTIKVLKQVAVRPDTQLFIIICIMVLILIIVSLVFIFHKNGITWKKGWWKR